MLSDLVVPAAGSATLISPRRVPQMTASGKQSNTSLCRPPTTSSRSRSRPWVLPMSRPLLSVWFGSANFTRERGRQKAPVFLSTHFDRHPALNAVRHDDFIRPSLGSRISTVPPSDATWRRFSFNNTWCIERIRGAVRLCAKSTFTLHYITSGLVSAPDYNCLHYLHSLGILIYRGHNNNNNNNTHTGHTNMTHETLMKC